MKRERLYKVNALHYVILQLQRIHTGPTECVKWTSLGGSPNRKQAMLNSQVVSTQGDMNEALSHPVRGWPGRGRALWWL